jgi:hypothetical protein
VVKESSLIYKNIVRVRRDEERSTGWIKAKSGFPIAMPIGEISSRKLGSEEKENENPPCILGEANEKEK